MSDVCSTLRPGRIPCPEWSNTHCLPYIPLYSAGHYRGGGWNIKPAVSKGQEADVFLGVLYWESDEARRQWYDDYSRMSYDDFGWRVEGLRKTASLGVESYCLPLIGNEKEHMAFWERHGFPAGGVKR